MLSERFWAQAGGRQALGSAESALGKPPPELNLGTCGCLLFEKHMETLSPNVLLRIKKYFVFHRYHLQITESERKITHMNIHRLSYGDICLN